LKYNPNAWEIYAQIGDIYFIMNHDYAKSITYFRQAYLFMRSSEVNNIEKRHVLTLLAASFERSKDYGQSVYYYKKILELYPLDEGLKNRIEELQRWAGGVQAVN
ncbi:MAG: tetratricopeptide repeat protein, partial [Candidatus Omnitrophica bacterium]|nr:tetratricopeptide repeat protein [Candidatus Omnitrophota bacterium]